MRLVGRILLWTFAVIGFCVFLVAAGIGVLHFFPIGVDPTRVVAVVPNPDDKQAAVVYLHHFADNSVDLVAVKLIRPPFPAVGAPIQPFGDLLTVRGDGIDGWAFRSRPGVEDIARDMVAIRWNAAGVDVCPKSGARMVQFNSNYSDDEGRRITLCQMGAQ